MRLFRLFSYYLPIGAFMLASLFQVDLSAGYYKITKVVANTSSGNTKATDANLVNSWGLVFDDQNLLVCDNGSDLLTTYSPRLGVTEGPLVSAHSAPTGIVQNFNEKAFIITPKCGPAYSARFLVATESGTILAYNKNANPDSTVVVIDRSAKNAVYKGIALVNGAQGPQIFATDFHNGVIDVFNDKFEYTFSFTSPEIPVGFAPFNVTLLPNHKKVYVTYAKQKGPDNHDDEAGPGNGYIVTFDVDGHNPQTLIAKGKLNSPWGMVLTGTCFGEFSNSFVVGNFGDGSLNVYGIRDGEFRGQLKGRNEGKPLVLDGLWALLFNDTSLYFSSGPNGEQNGLVGYIEFIGNK